MYRVNFRKQVGQCRIQMQSSHLPVARIIAPNIRGSREGRLMQGSHDIGGSAMGVGIGQVRLDSKVG